MMDKIPKMLFIIAVDLRLPGGCGTTEITENPSFIKFSYQLSCHFLTQNHPDKSSEGVGALLCATVQPYKNQKSGFIHVNNLINVSHVKSQKCD